MDGDGLILLLLDICTAAACLAEIPLKAISAGLISCW
jgi:hypothetical protein